MTIEELKAKAYDTLSAIEYLQGQLRDINKQIGDKVAEGKTPEVTPSTDLKK